MVTIINTSTNNVERAQFNSDNLAPNEVAIDKLYTGSFVVPKYDFETKDFYEGADQTEIEEANKLIVPNEVQLWRVRTVLKLMGLEETISNALEQLEEPTKTGAKTIWEYGTTIERHSQTVLFLQYVLQMTDAQVDEIFTQAEAIAI